MSETGMRLAVNLGPDSEWDQILSGARRADELGLDAVSVFDHYHSERPEWGWLSGWALWGALAANTSRVRLVPMVIDRLNYLPGVLAKEAAVLSHLSGDRLSWASAPATTSSSSGPGVCRFRTRRHGSARWRKRLLRCEVFGLVSRSLWPVSTSS